jgi:hypothetical protein
MKRYALAALCLAVFVVPVRAQSPEERKLTAAYVQKLQTNIGGFLGFEPKPNERVRPTLRATSAAVRALKYLGAPVPNRDTCAKYVDECFNKETGGFGDGPGMEPDVFSTAVGLMAVAELKMPLDKYADPAVKYLGESVKTFDDVRIAVAGLERLGRKAPKADAWKEIVEEEGKKKARGKDYAREMASIAVTRMRLGEDYGAAEDFVKHLKADQRDDGGFAKHGEDKSDLETTYRVMRCFMMLKARPANVEDLRSYVAKCRNEDNGYSAEPDERSTVGATYYAAIINHWLDAKK